MNIQEANQRCADLMKYKGKGTGIFFIEDIRVAPLDFSEREKFIKAFWLNEEYGYMGDEYTVIALVVDQNQKQMALSHEQIAQHISDALSTL